MKTKINISFIISKSNHIIINCKINGIDGLFIIDTGASNFCIDFLSADKFNLCLIKSDEKAYSATNKINDIYYSKNNILEIGNYKNNKFEVLLFNMTNINNSLKEKKVKKIDGIIGGDTLKELNANIDYKQKNN